MCTHLRISPLFPPFSSSFHSSCNPFSHHLQFPFNLILSSYCLFPCLIFCFWVQNIRLFFSLSQMDQ
uniref:Uncharacterized protein n=1 Tax=Manihot esculenta TaxID=3983 RepID=A0A2C9W9B5_MANES